ncbi:MULTISPECIES: hypothetical protein [unclassified Saccharicrinis]|uniref:hypothetical protein n=1 Tax=unclassified Saccharicrinis TaxID=2646859 RepID=UPI003D3327E1
MKKLVFRLLFVCFLATGLGGGAAVFAQDHDAVTDSLSIDDMAPVLYDEDAYEEEEKGSNGVIIGIVIAVVAIGGIGFVALKKKK